MKVTVEFVGYIRKSTLNSRALLKLCGLYYTWKDVTSVVSEAEKARFFDVDSSVLMAATDRQVVVGRNNREKLDGVLVEVLFCGVIQKCKKNMRLLVRDGMNYYTVPVPVGDVPVVDEILVVDKRKMLVARQDQIDMGLGRGTLKRKRKQASK
jgi:hypothetical protein